MDNEIKKEEDLVLGSAEEVEAEEILVDDPFEEYDLHAEITSACNALGAIADMDEALFSKEKARMIRVIRRKSLEIIYENIGHIHAQIFERKEEEEEEE
jgi:hypothetical protein